MLEKSKCAVFTIGRNVQNWEIFFTCPSGGLLGALKHFCSWSRALYPARGAVSRAVRRRVLGPLAAVMSISLLGGGWSTDT